MYKPGMQDPTFHIFKFALTAAVAVACESSTSLYPEFQQLATYTAGLGCHSGAAQWMSGNIVSSPSLSSNCLMKCSEIHIRSDIRTEYIPGHGGDGACNTSCARLCFGEAQQQYVIIMACVWGFTGVYCII